MFDINYASVYEFVQPNTNSTGCSVDKNSKVAKRNGFRYYISTLNARITLGD